MTRFIPSIPGLAYARVGDRLYVNLHVQGRMSTELEGENIALEQERKRPEIRVNGKEVEVALEQGYAPLRRSWKTGDVVESTLPMPVEPGPLPSTRSKPRPCASRSSSRKGGPPASTSGGCGGSTPPRRLARNITRVLAFESLPFIARVAALILLSSGATPCGPTNVTGSPRVLTDL